MTVVAGEPVVVHNMIENELKNVDVTEIISGGAGIDVSNEKRLLNSTLQLSRVYRMLGFNVVLNTFKFIAIVN